MESERIQKKLNHIDYEILKIINERLELVLRSKTLEVSPQENHILARLKTFCESHRLLSEIFTGEILRAIMSESHRLQQERMRLIGFQGEHGAFGEVAARDYDPDLIPVPCPQFSDVFEGVERGEFELGIVPVQNSLGGAVNQVNELLLETELRVVGAIKLRINHCLLAHPDTDYRGIASVFSHPQALSQCQDFLKKHNLEPRPYYDTAGAARMLAKENPHMAAAIASKLCAQLYNLEIIKENIEDHEANITRFLILAKEEDREGMNKCSIIFSTPHKAGALFAVLKIFADDEVNLTRIESFPNRKDPGQYVFFLDFQIPDIDGDAGVLLDKVKSTTVMFKYLGCYREDM